MPSRARLRRRPREPTVLELSPGLICHPGLLSAETQTLLRDVLAGVLAEAPPFTPRMPRTGKPFSVRMTNCGPLGWVSDAGGYRYQPLHPETGRPWPPIPEIAMAAWRKLSGCAAPPEACLINLYDAGARMGLHQDRDEEDFSAPVLSLSLGDAAVFRWGGTTRQAPTRSIKLRSGDALVLGGPARLAFHGIDRVLGGSSSLLPWGGRLNLTLRKVRQGSDTSSV